MERRGGEEKRRSEGAIDNGLFLWKDPSSLYTRQMSATIAARKVDQF